uniref:Uncharacterized protein n=1 Tax=Arundo donax TaxID=35708 RepID=A0A0A9FZC0_ARUDO
MVGSVTGTTNHSKQRCAVYLGLNCKVILKNICFC